MAASVMPKRAKHSAVSKPRSFLGTTNLLSSSPKHALTVKACPVSESAWGRSGSVSSALEKRPGEWVGCTLAGKELLSSQTDPQARKSHLHAIGRRVRPSALPGVAKNWAEDMMDVPVRVSCPFQERESMEREGILTGHLVGNVARLKKLVHWVVKQLVL